MAHEIIELKEYTNKTGKRFKVEGEFSGEWFLEDILWPNIKNTCLVCHCPLEIDLNDVEISPQFIDQAFTKLVAKYKFIQTNEYLMFKCKDKNIIADILAAIVGAEFKTFNHVFTKI